MMYNNVSTQNSKKEPIFNSWSFKNQNFMSSWKKLCHPNLKAIILQMKLCALWTPTTILLTCLVYRPKCRECNQFNHPLLSVVLVLLGPSSLPWHLPYRHWKVASSSDACHAFSCCYHSVVQHPTDCSAVSASHYHAPSISLPLCCVYLQAVPCDPAGTDFNFAALSFNSEFLHQIHLVQLHPCRPLEKPRAFMVSARGKKCYQRH